MPVPPVPAAEIAADVRRALEEDIGAGDLSAALIPSGPGEATVITRAAGVLCGRAWFDAAFLQLNPEIRSIWHAADGDEVAPGQILCELAGDAHALLSGERTALNFLQLLSGVASKTRRAVACVAGTRARIVDTRKTLPGLRQAQKYAVRVGGGDNHRLALWDAILLKENHILAAGSIRAALAAAFRAAEAAGARCRFIQIEVETLAELAEALAAGAPMVLLDNFDLATLAEAVALNHGRAILEASGGVDFVTLPAIAQTGVDRISIGALTKDIQALDLSMRFTVPQTANLRTAS
ncbi:MAG: carboxylating nicotinate-nucleotide diphosphorylase [Zoogloeaceae bacterium]|jgi:nicotinate-nucleotide pyrophosphorylase (carboxylating)|nr:carboxylating nicotinate-nucleotide diphosphorylase [Zoogloeaceae bacterium]